MKDEINRLYLKKYTKKELKTICRKLFNSSLKGNKDDYIDQLTRMFNIYGNTKFNIELVSLIINNNIKLKDDFYINDKTYIYMIRRSCLSTYEEFLYKYYLGLESLYNDFRDKFIKVKLDSSYIFKDQFNSETTRYIEKEYIIIKTARYKYLENLRKNIFECGYCGKQYKDQSLVYCDSCRGSEYLTHDNYYLLELKPICSNFRDKSKKIPTFIVDDIAKKQKETLAKKQKDKLNSLKNNIKNNIENMLIEININEYLLQDHLVLLADGFIFYKHKNTLVFNWKKENKSKEFYKVFNNYKNKIEKDLGVSVECS